MDIQQKINELHIRQLALRAIMASSDDRAAKCVKQGLSFCDTYPDEYAHYCAANVEYNEIEQLLAELEAEESKSEIG